MSAKKDNKNGPGAVIKDLSQLGSLLKENKKPATLVSVAPKAPTSSIQLDPEGDTLENIWRVMADYKGRTASEVERVFEIHLVPSEDVVTMLKLLHNSGYFLTTGRPENPIYSMKKGVEMPNNNQKEQGFRHYKQRAASAPISQYDPMAKVDPAEGLDCTLWKLTRDRKNRSLDEIGELARTFGFAPHIVRDRVIFLANKHWYDRTGTGNKTKYALKKNIPFPKPENQEVKTPANEIKVNSTTTFHSRNEKDYSDRVVNTNAPAVTQTHQVKEETMQEQTPAKQVLPLTPLEEDLVVRKGDSWDLAIWKMMRDFKQYTAQDVGLLLSDLGFNPKSTQVRISKLHLDHDWFEREKMEGTRSFKYRLKRDVARPVDPNAAPVVETKAAEAKQEELPNLQPQAPVAATLNEPVKTPFVSPEIHGLAKQIAADMDHVNKGGAVAPLGATLKGARDDLLKASEETIRQIGATEQGRDMLADVMDAAAKKANTPGAMIAANAAREAGIINTPKDEKATMTKTNTTTTPEAKPATPNLAGGKYLKFVVQVKDISMSMEEARTLHAKLKAHGFGDARTVPVSDENTNLFSATYRIKGKDFSATMVQEIAIELETYGFGDATNFAE